MGLLLYKGFSREFFSQRLWKQSPARFSEAFQRKFSRRINISRLFHQSRALVSITYVFDNFTIKFVEVRLLLDLDVIRPWGNSHPSTKLGIGIGQYECYLCALEKRYYRYTRKINFEEHFEKHSIGKSFKIFFNK